MEATTPTPHLTPRPQRSPDWQATWRWMLDLRDRWQVESDNAEDSSRLPKWCGLLQFLSMHGQANPNPNRNPNPKPNPNALSPPNLNPSPTPNSSPNPYAKSVRSTIAHQCTSAWSNRHSRLKLPNVRNGPTYLVCLGLIVSVSCATFPTLFPYLELSPYLEGVESYESSWREAAQSLSGVCYSSHQVSRISSTVAVVLTPRPQAMEARLVELQSQSRYTGTAAVVGAYA